MWRITGYSSVIPLPPRIVRARAARPRARRARCPSCHADVLRSQRPVVLHATEVERDERAAVDLERHLGELLLRELVAGDRLAEDDALLRVVERGLEARARGADGAPHDPVARLVQARERAAQRRRPPGSGSPPARARPAARARRSPTRGARACASSPAPRSPACRVSTRKPLISPVVGARPHDRDVGDRAVRDPHLRSVEDPVGAVAARVRAHRTGVGAGVRLGEPEAADRLARVHRAAASAASAPPSPSARSRTSPATPAPRRGCGRPSRRPRAPCRSARTRRRSRRAGRSRRGACRRGRAARSPARAPAAGCPARTTRRRSAATRSCTNCRTVSRIARSSSSSSASTARKSRGSSAVLVVAVTP